MEPPYSVVYPNPCVKPQPYLRKQKSLLQNNSMITLLSGDLNGVCFYLGRHPYKEGTASLENLPLPPRARDPCVQSPATTTRPSRVCSTFSVGDRGDTHQRT